MSLRLVVSIMMIITATTLGMIAYRFSAPMPAPVGATADNAPVLPLRLGYIVAARPLPAGSFIRDEDLAIKSVPSSEFPADAITDQPDNQANLRGAMVRRFVDAGTMITQADLLRPRDRGFLATVLEPGTRAISLPVDAVSGVSGLIWPGDRVDVILTQEMDHNVAPLARRVLSETILTDVRVIGVDQDIVRASPAAGTSGGRVAHTVTLQVANDQAERAAIAQQLGHLALAIRALDSKPPTAGSEQPTLFSGDVSPALSRTTEPAGVKVQVIDGDKRSEVTFQ